MLWIVAMLALAQPCERGAAGAQCVTCTPSDRGTQVCRGVCYTKRPGGKEGDAGFDSFPLKGEDKDEKVAREKVDKQAKEKCG